MAATPQHTYQILTKRADRVRRLAPQLDWPPNVWMGVSIESDNYAFRADHLRDVPAAIRFLSVEPLIGPVPSLDFTDIEDPMRVVNVQLREQAEAAIKDKVATMGVDDVSPIDAEWVADQARCVLEDMTVAAFKIGLLGSVEQIVAAALYLVDADFTTGVVLPVTGGAAV